MSRDRDRLGKPRNARPRDALGRPLSRDADPQPDVPDVPDTLPGGEAARLADEFLRSGHPFHAHEALEAAWKSGPPAERDLWQGLAQIAVGLTHAYRGNARGAVTLLRRGAERASGYQGSSYSIDVPGFTDAAAGLAGRIERDGLSSLSTADLRPGLLT